MNRSRYASEVLEKITFQDSVRNNIIEKIFFFSSVIGLNIQILIHL